MFFHQVCVLRHVCRAARQSKKPPHLFELTIYLFLDAFTASHTEWIAIEIPRQVFYLVRR